MKEILNSTFYLPRYSKRLIAMMSDACLCILCTWFAFVLRLEELILFKDFNFYPALISVFMALPIFWLFGLYRTIFRYTSLSIILNILISTFLYGLLYFLVIGVYGVSSYTSYFTIVPRSIGILQPMLLFFAILSSRLGVKYLLNSNYNLSKSYNKKNVLVYGSSDSGRQFVLSLENSIEYNVKGFIDDNIELHRQVLLGQTIYSSSNLEELVKTRGISLVFLALPSTDRNLRNKIIKRLNKYKLIVKTLPSISELVDGRISVSDIKDLNINDLLNRDEVEPDIELLSKNINSKTVAVTGAGGSIGSELCRQIARLKPTQLILIEFNEYALYNIYEELIKLNKNLKIISLLVNTQDQLKLEEIFETFKVNTVYHAAAYKHVPLVEENICAGVKNNVFSTLAVAKAALIKKVSNVVLISSDKAVRPTNIMGASKRLSEICMQSVHNHNKDISSNFAIVRFGNVLESSGSVIPKFKKQIKEGGPITLTHKDVTRYFMTAREASQLVIQAGSMGKYSEVFVLDMGESVKIKDLICKMINLSGFTVKDSNNPTGDIEIKIIGLRSGEKLYEELLIGENPEKTFHKKIQKAQDPFIPFNELKIDLDNLSNLLEDGNISEVKNILNKLVPSFESNSKIIDHVYKKKINYKDEIKVSNVEINQENKVIKFKK